MTIEFSCGGCQYPFKVPDSMAGKQGKCPKCGTITAIPTSSSSGLSAAPPPRPAYAPAQDTGLDDFDDRPGPRRRKKSGKGLAIWLSLAALVLLVGGGLAVYFIWFNVGSLSDDDMKYFPDGAQFVVAIRVDEFMESKFWKDIKTEIPGNLDADMNKMEQEVGIKLDKIDRVIVAGVFPSAEELAGGNPVAEAKINGDPKAFKEPRKIKEPKDPIVIVKTKTAVKGEDMIANIKNRKFTESKVGKYTIYEPELKQFESSKPSFSVVDSKTIVVGQKTMLEEVLKRDKKPDLSSELRTAMNKADFKQTFAFAVNMKGVIPKELLEKKPDQRMPLDVRPYGKIVSIYGSYKVSSDFTANITAVCEDSKSAEAVKSSTEGAISFAKVAVAFVMSDAVSLIDKIKVSQSGSNATVTMTVKSSEVKEIAKKAKEMKKQ